MGHPGELVDVVSARIQHDEMVRRIGRPVPVPVPAGAPPIVALAARSFPPEVRARRERLHRVLGWTDGEDLPAVATLEDRVTVARDLDVGDPDAEAWWDALFDAVADGVDPGWRARPRGGDGAFARLEAVTLLSDAYFGRRRRAVPWTALHEAVRWAGTMKRRLVG